MGCRVLKTPWQLRFTVAGAALCFKAAWRESPGHLFQIETWAPPRGLTQILKEMIPGICLHRVPRDSHVQMRKGNAPEARAQGSQGKTSGEEFNSSGGPGRCDGSKKAACEAWVLPSLWKHQVSSSTQTRAMLWELQKPGKGLR